MCSRFFWHLLYHQRTNFMGRQSLSLRGRNVYSFASPVDGAETEGFFWKNGSCWQANTLYDKFLAYSWNDCWFVEAQFLWSNHPTSKLVGPSLFSLLFALKLSLIFCFIIFLLCKQVSCFWVLLRDDVTFSKNNFIKNTFMKGKAKLTDVIYVMC